ncbi:MAG: PEP/pyruvate-binding domain-containing protein [Nocardiopsaceae bacterium]|nr:PEP/pyruvate-binding domain-containing protein [Nocardiopsaceae bacterium]
MTELTQPLSEAGGAGVAGVAGGKGASLGELARAGIAVPDGFVVTTAAFTAALAAVDPDGSLRASVEALPADDVPLIAERAGAFRERIRAAPVPREVAAAITSAYAATLRSPDISDMSPEEPDPGVAVRSSATAEDSAGASFAGLADTYLGVRGAASVLEHVRRCWASLYNDESVAYRRRIGVPETGLAMAVVVQRMIAPRAAGVMFTRSPVTGDRSVVAIEGTWGLGSALVAGDVTPDSFAVSKVTGEITARRVSAKERLHAYSPGAHGVTVSETPEHLRREPCLTDAEIVALASAARRVEAHYGVPQDIEWALLDGDAPAESRVVFLQSRPETVWASRDAAQIATPLPRPADHVLSRFTRPL